MKALIDDCQRVVNSRTELGAVTGIGWLFSSLDISATIPHGLFGVSAGIRGSFVQTNVVGSVCATTFPLDGIYNISLPLLITNGGLPVKCLSVLGFGQRASFS